MTEQQNRDLVLELKLVLLTTIPAIVTGGLAVYQYNVPTGLGVASIFMTPLIMIHLDRYLLKKSIANKTNLLVFKLLGYDETQYLHTFDCNTITVIHREDNNALKIKYRDIIGSMVTFNVHPERPLTQSADHIYVIKPLLRQYHYGELKGQLMGANSQGFGIGVLISGLVLLLLTELSPLDPAFNIFVFAGISALVMHMAGSVSLSRDPFLTMDKQMTLFNHGPYQMLESIATPSFTAG